MPKTMSMEMLMFRPNLLKGSRVLITGGGAGLGKVMAEACLALGAEIYICGRRRVVLEQAAAGLVAAHGGKVTTVPCDIRDADSVETMLDKIWSNGGALDGLVNNAAGNFISRTEDLSIGGFDAIANTVMRGSFLVTLGCGKRWIAEGVAASVVSIVTSWVWSGGPFTVPSAMAKAGLHAMTQSLAVEWGPKNIRFNAIAPGTFPTEGLRARLRPGETESYVDERVPLGRSGQMSELANLVVFLLAPGSEYLTGQTIAIDGGAHQAGAGTWFSKLRGWGDDQWTAARLSIREADAKEKGLRVRAGPATD